MKAIPPGEAPSAEALRYRYVLAGVFWSSICAETAFLDIGIYERSRQTCSYASKIERSCIWQIISVFRAQIERSDRSILMCRLFVVGVRVY